MTCRLVNLTHLRLPAVARRLRLLGMALLLGGMVAGSGCLGRGNDTSTGPSQNTGTVAAAARAADTPFAGSCGQAVDPAFAVQHANTEQTVVGPVVAAHYDAAAKDAPTYLEMGAAYPDPKSLSVVVLGADRASFPAPPEQLYQGKTICVIGVVQNYMQRKAIIAGQPESISVISNNASTP